MIARLIARATSRWVDKLEMYAAQARAELAVDDLNTYERIKELESNLDRLLELQESTAEELRTEELRSEQQADQLERKQRALQVATQAAQGWRESFQKAHEERNELLRKGHGTAQAYQAICESLDSRKWWVVVADQVDGPAEIFSSLSMAQAAHPSLVVYGAKLIG